MVASILSKRARARSNPVSPAAAVDPLRSDPTASRTNTLAPSVENAIYAERRELQKAAAILGCLVIALEYGDDDGPMQGPDPSDVARAVRGMIERSVTGLDPTNLRRIAAYPPTSSDD